MLTGKFDGRLRKEIIFPPNKKTRENIKRLMTKLIINERPTRFIDSLSDFGSTIASSYRKEEITMIIPTRLK
jgi:adenine-specific DNA glycosylase